MMYTIKQEGLYQNKVNSSLVSNCNSVTVKWVTRRVCALGGGGYSLSWPIWGGCAGKGYLFQASGMRKGRDFTR